jgi:hypothetical protein
VNLVEIAKNTFIDPSTVVSIEHDVVNEWATPSPSDSRMVKVFDGTRITLNNGRKVFVNGVMPEEIIRRLKPEAPQTKEETPLGKVE